MSDTRPREFERAEHSGNAERREESAPDDPQSRSGGGFDPTPYLRQLRGRGGQGEYLDVKWRLLWLRTEHPDAEIVTELVQYEPQMAIFKATVTIPTGGKATGYGSETATDFADFVEKAETKAIGRALNALGYGAQFSERGDDTAPERMPTAASEPPPPVPLPRRGPRPEAPPAAKIEPSPSQAAIGPHTAPPAAPASAPADLADYSWSAFWPWARERGLNGPREIEILIGQPVAGLSPAELRELILAADSQ